MMEASMLNEIPFKPRSSLRDTTQRLLSDKIDDGSVSIAQIAKDTGLAIYWLQNFRRNFSQKADVTHVQTLYEYLSGRQLQV